jgi:hypothetical protein
LVAAVIVHDVATTRKLHPATILGIAFSLGPFFASQAFGATELGLSLVRWLR